MENIKDLYIDLLQRSLLDIVRLNKGKYAPLRRKKGIFIKGLFLLQWVLRKGNFAIVRDYNNDKDKILEGRFVPPNAETMIGFKRMENIKRCVLETVNNSIEGDLIETGAFRGGATIFMRGILKALDCKNKLVYVADSFEGLPEPDDVKYPADKGSRYHKMEELVASIDEVKGNFKNYNLLDDQVVFLKGFFKYTLPVAPIEKLSILRLDGDMYESTMDALVNLYPKLSIGGFIIIDDYAIPNCKKAIDDYRSQNKIEEKIEQVDWTGIYWKKTANFN
jgi:O-methyltransferase